MQFDRKDPPLKGTPLQKVYGPAKSGFKGLEMEISISRMKNAPDVHKKLKIINWKIFWPKTLVEHNQDQKRHFRAFR